MLRPGAEPIHGWPEPRGVEPGLYSFEAKPGNRSWMHRLPKTSLTDALDSVELTFYAAEAADLPVTTASNVLGRSLWDDGPFKGHPARVLDVQSQVWLLDIDGTRVAILLDSFPDTDPNLVAEAEAVIESIVVEPAGDGGPPRLVFRLLEYGWDSG